MIRRLVLMLLVLLVASPAAAMKLNILKGTTCSNAAPRSCLVDIFIQDSSSTVGAGLTGLTNASANLICYYARSDQGNAGGTQLTLSAGTLGTWSSGGFKEKDATNMKGIYELGLATTMIASGSNFVLLDCSGATNMAPMLLEIALTDYDPQDSIRLGLTALPNVASGGAGAIPTTGTGANQIQVDGAGALRCGGTIKKNVSNQTYPVLMVLASDNISAALGKTLTVTEMKDGSTTATTITGTSAETANGWYLISFSQGDTNCNTCEFLVTAAGAAPRRFYLLTGP